MSKLRDTGLRLFNASGYEILDQDLLTKGELMIWSTSTVVPRLGERFTVECAGGVHEVEVDALTRLRGGWSAHCHLYGLVS